MPLERPASSGFAHALQHALDGKGTGNDGAGCMTHDESDRPWLMAIMGKGMDGKGKGMDTESDSEWPWEIGKGKDKGDDRNGKGEADDGKGKGNDCHRCDGKRRLRAGPYTTTTSGKGEDPTDKKRDATRDLFGLLSEYVSSQSSAPTGVDGSQSLGPAAAETSPAMTLVQAAGRETSGGLPSMGSSQQSGGSG